MIPVVDLFAGPGGLNEGFSCVVDTRGEHVFNTVASFEMEPNAVRTLQLRAALRRLRDGNGFPHDYYRFLNAELSEVSFLSKPHIDKALSGVLGEEVHPIRLGESNRPEVDGIIRSKTQRDDSPFVLIGGPPCQAYSLAGRSRRAHDATFADDEKHFLFREYLHIIEQFEPIIFVMENVKGLLSSTHSGRNMFQMIREDLSVNGKYEIRSLVVPEEAPRSSDYVIRAERYGVPQRRHRVILLGVHQSAGVTPENLEERRRVTTLRDVLFELPVVRSQISPRRMDNKDDWAAVREEGRAAAGLGRLRGKASLPPELGGPFVGYTPALSADPLRRWLVDDRLTHLTHHHPRSHMRKDLIRYEYLALRMLEGERPNVLELPPMLRPDHANVRKEVTPFLDRFKVQDWEAPSSTVTSHVAKDGHYFIHPDPEPMRSLTVREAARLQTFPDNYFFSGNRTAQYHQVGNAVPPYLAFQIGKVVARALGRDVR